MSRRTILFAAGGSGGHLFPAIAVAEELQRHDNELRIGIVASEKEIDRSILARTPFERHHLASISPGRIWREPWTVLSENWHAWRAARQLIREQSPSVVVGCGGFASAPLVCAAIRAGVPVVLLEQNLIPGRANVWLSRWATKVCLSFEETRAYLPRSVQYRAGVVTITGNPVRRSMLPSMMDSPHNDSEQMSGREGEAPAEPGQGVSVLPGSRLSRSFALPNEPVPSRLPNQLLILGGSQGARHLNEAVAEWVATRPAELKGWHLIHQTGAGDQPAIAERYALVSDFLQAEAVEFITDPSVYYRTATLVIARAGATSLAELACLGAPTVLIPLPTAARDHQTANARWYADQGAARLVFQAATPPQTALQLAAAVTPLLSDHSARHQLSLAITQAAHPQAANAVAQIVALMTPTANTMCDASP